MSEVYVVEADDNNKVVVEAVVAAVGSVVESVSMAAESVFSSDNVVQD